MRIVQIDLNKDYSDVIREAVIILTYGGVIVYPTDTLYGLGSNAMNIRAVEKVFKIKKRSLSKPLPIIAKNLVWANEMAYINKKNELILSKVWPGKVTAILPKKNVIPNIVTSGNMSVGIRIPDFVFVDKLLGKFGYPLTSTSANLSGEEGSGDINKIIEVFRASDVKPELIIDAGVLPKSDPSMVLDLTTEKPKILRVGATSPEQLLKLLEI